MADETQNKPSKMKKLLWTGITFIVLAGYWLFKKADFTTKTVDPVKDNQTVVDSLREQVQTKNENNDATIESLRDSIEFYKFIVRKNNQTINDLKIKIDEKANNSVTLTGNELYQFLSDRYRDSIK